jgi:hypothetical protein
MNHTEHIRKTKYANIHPAKNIKTTGIAYAVKITRPTIRTAKVGTVTHSAIDAANKVVIVAVLAKALLEDMDVQHGVDFEAWKAE